MIGIYKITNKTNNCCYIGQSVNIKKRFREHKRVAFLLQDPKSDYPLYRAIRKHGLNNFSFEVLEYCEVDDLPEKERYYIELYNSCKNGYNQTEETVNPMHDKKVRKKQLEKTRSKEFRTQQSIRSKKMWESEELKQKYALRFAEMNREKWKDERYREEKSKFSSELQKKRLQDESYLKEKSAQLKKATDKMKRPIAQYSLDGQLIATFNGVREAERATGIMNPHKCAKGDRKTAGGFVWRYLD